MMKNEVDAFGWGSANIAAAMNNCSPNHEPFGQNSVFSLGAGSSGSDGLSGLLSSFDQRAASSGSSVAAGSASSSPEAKNTSTTPARTSSASCAMSFTVTAPKAANDDSDKKSKNILTANAVGNILPMDGSSVDNAGLGLRFGGGGTGDGSAARNRVGSTRGGSGHVKQLSASSSNCSSISPIFNPGAREFIPKNVSSDSLSNKLTRLRVDAPSFSVPGGGHKDELSATASALSQVASGATIRMSGSGGRQHNKSISDGGSSLASSRNGYERSALDAPSCASSGSSAGAATAGTAPPHENPAPVLQQQQQQQQLHPGVHYVTMDGRHVRVSSTSSQPQTTVTPAPVAVQQQPAPQVAYQQQAQPQQQQQQQQQQYYMYTDPATGMQHLVAAAPQPQPQPQPQQQQQYMITRCGQQYILTAPAQQAPAPPPPQQQQQQYQYVMNPDGTMSMYAVAPQPQPQPAPAAPPGVSYFMDPVTKQLYMMPAAAAQPAPQPQYVVYQ